MSTSNTIVRGPNFHLYTDSFDEDNVYLELDKVEFSVEYGEVTLTIPHAIWEVLRQHSGVSLEGIDETDEELLLKATQKVDERLALYETTEGRMKKMLVGACGLWVYGSIDAPRSEQIARGFDYLKSEQNRKQNIRQQILELQENNR